MTAEDKAKTSDSEESRRKDQAEAEKLAAEADQIRQQIKLNAERMEAERRKLVAEERKLLAEAEKAEAEAFASKLIVEQAQENRVWQLADNKYHRVYTFNDTVGSQSVRSCMRQLDIWSRIDPKCDITIIFDSPGGSVIDGMALFDYLLQIRKAEHRLHTTTLGYAASMAGILLQAGDVRSMGSESYVLVHEISFGVGGKIGEVEDEVAFVKKIQGRVLDIFAARSTLSKKQIENRWKRRDWWLDSEEALRLGFVDKII